jgi:aldose 1-epimerase
MSLSDRRAQVEGSSADFRHSRLIEDALPALYRAHGDIYLLRAPDAPLPESPRLAAHVSEGRSGRALDVLTDESCLQFYTGAMLDGTHVGKSGNPYLPHAGFCLECHGYPNASGLTGFGDILVRPDRPQRRRTIYAFSTS